MHKTLILSLVLAVCLIAVASAERMETINHQAIEGFENSSDPVILDTQEDMIAYDTAPTYYYQNLNEIGTLFAVRFTPLQPCSLTYIQVVSYEGAGNATIHVWSDDNGLPGDDLITPFTANLSGNLSYQRIDLPVPTNIGLDDFHVGVEYTQPSPPHVTVDGDGATEQRSKYKTPGGQWTALSHDLNFRAFVIYVGDDQVPPVINHAWQIFGFSEDDEHPISAEITDGSGIASATVHYNADGVNWETVSMTNTSDDTWESAIPLQEVGTTVLYYLSAVDASPWENEAFDPPNAPSDLYVMNIIEGSEIAYDDGSAEAWYIVDTSFADNAFATRMTPGSYPAQVIMARAFVNGATPFTFTINDVYAGIPDDVIPGGEAVTAVQEPHGWAIGEWSDGPVIESGSFFLVFHWDPSSPDDPGVGEDQDNILYRSYWFNNAQGWNLVADGEWMMRTIVSTPTGIEEISSDGVMPAQFELVGNYPNPFNPSTEIEFIAPIAGNVSVEVYNIAGQLVKTVFNGSVEPGIRTVSWDATDNNGNNVTSGVYFYKLIAGDKVDTRKMVLVK